MRVSIYLEGQEDLVNGLLMGITRVTMWVIGFLTYLLSPADPPSRAFKKARDKTIARWRTKPKDSS